MFLARYLLWTDRCQVMQNVIEIPLKGWMVTSMKLNENGDFVEMVTSFKNLNHIENPKNNSNIKKNKFPDCSLRQGAGGAEFARFGSRTCFLR